MSWLDSIFGAPGTAAAPSSSPAPSLSRPPSPLKPSAAPLRAEQPAFSSVKRTLSVAVLLNGNTNLFAPHFFAQGRRGGRLAALELRRQIHTLVTSHTPDFKPEVLVLAKVFLDVAALEKQLEGVDVRAFMQGFNSSPLAFSAVDVGTGMLAVDEAIKGHLPFLFSACDLILLGSNSTGTFAYDLLRLDPSTLREKVALVRTVEECSERLLDLGLQELRLPGLFAGEEAKEEQPATAAPPAPPVLPPFLSHLSSTSFGQASPFASPSFSRTPSFTSTTSPVKPLPASFLAQPSTVASSSASPTPTPSLPGAFGAIGTPVRVQSPAPALSSPSKVEAVAPSFLADIFSDAREPSVLARVVPVTSVAPVAPPSPSSSAPWSPTLPSLTTSPDLSAAAVLPPASSAVPPSPSKANEVDPAFRPLLNLLRVISRETGQPRVLCSVLGGRLKGSGTQYTSLRAYLNEAERKGYVVTGEGEKQGREWVAVKGTEEQQEKGKQRAEAEARPSTPCKPSKTFLSGNIGATAPTAPPSMRVPSMPPSFSAAPSFPSVLSFAAAPAAPTTTAFSPKRSASSSLAHYKHIDPKFRPLLNLLAILRQEKGWRRPLRSNVGDRLRQLGVEYESFAAYAAEAEKKGYVVLGKGKKNGQDWISVRGYEGEFGEKENWELGKHHGEEEDETNEHAEQNALASALEGLKIGITCLSPLLSPYSSPSSPTTRPARARCAPSSAIVGEHLRKENLARGPGSRLFDPAAREGLRKYFDDAVEKGWVRMERGEKVGADWVELVDPEAARTYLATPPPRAPQPSPQPALATALSADVRADVRPIPPHFVPLLLAIQANAYPAPHWTSIGFELNRVKPRPYEDGGFKAYVLEAERERWIETGEPQAHISLAALSPEALEQLASSRVSAPSTASASAAPRASGSIPSKFVPLVDTIRSQPISAPHWTNVGAILNRVQPRVYGGGEFKAYVLEAVKEGIIITGAVEGKAGCHWMRLTVR
ncbi:hypothetical protein JCM8097_001064 [Rhodosporidiobolus ruineniae]